MRFEQVIRAAWEEACRELADIGNDSPLMLPREDRQRRRQLRRVCRWCRLRLGYALDGPGCE
jgi:hypothetical protein